ncbi:fec operon regulator FecR [compost metagenome]
MTAVGTVFDVRREKGEVRVTLVSGAVDVSSEKRAVHRLAAGHQARVTGAGVGARAVDVAVETSWTEGRIVLENAPLTQAIAEVNRYLTDKIELDAPGREAELVSGVFRAGDRDAFVSAATTTLDLRASAGKGGEVRLTAEK